MNSTLLRFLAVLLALGAIATAAIGYRLSTKQAPVALPTPSVTYPQAVAARDIPAGQILTAQDVRIESLTQRDANGYEAVSKVVGRLTLEPIPAGTALLSRHFPRLGQVAQALKPGERGIAVKVSEVVGVGGFVSPGDHVDVLYYIRGNKETGDISSSQIMLRDVRVLAFGEQVEETESKPNALQKMAGEANSANKAETPKQDSDKGKSSRSAVLAVQEKDASRLMLAESAGEIRLALRGAEPPQTGLQEEDAARYLRLAELSSPTAARPITTVSNATPKPAMKKITGQPAKKKSASATTSSVTVHRGDQVEVVTVKN
jgi:pilus assembly protein CpaB